MDFNTVRLWRDAFASIQEDPEASRARSRLREAFMALRERAKSLAAEIPRDMPDFTVHDISHLDALWEMADLIAGPQVSLTPPEAFLLGGGILLHDLGMSLAAYPGGSDELKRSEVWLDAVARLLRRELGRWPTAREIQNPPAAQASEATREALRLMHAEQAARLGEVSWMSASGTQYHLIDDPDLRGELGALLGSIAQSHHWPAARLKEEFSETIGAPGWCPRAWTMDPLKVACLLRLADASHLDSRRAPGFLQTLRRLRDVSEAHWTFQKKLLKPRLESERLVFSSSTRFSEAEAPAWWLCSDALHMVDRELRQVDALLTETGRTRLAARGVAGIENPQRLVELIRTEGWVPIDTRVRIQDVPSIVERFGGRQLYGDAPDVPLRELLQNACDAVRARRLLEERANDWGDVTVRLGRDEEGEWIEVEDTGLGMSQALLTGSLLDFGTSYWGSELAREECPGLWSRGFQPTGRYGIGFFSVFMWGNHVRVSTRRSEDSLQATRVLEFRQGVGSPPILRVARTGERLVDVGTRIRVWPQESLHERDNLLYPDKPLDHGPYTLCEYLTRSYPALDVNLYAEELPQAKKLVRRASEWMHKDGLALLKELGSIQYGDHFDSDAMEKMGRNLRLMKNPMGEVVGRACIDVQRRFNSTNLDVMLGILATGGKLTGYAKSMAGILTASPLTMARHSTCPDVDTATLAQWASEQAILWQREPISDEDKHWVAERVVRYGGDVGALPVALSARGWLTREAIATSQWPEPVILLDPVSIHAPRGYSTEFGYGVLEMHRNSDLNIIHPAILLVRFVDPVATDTWWSTWLESAAEAEASALAQGQTVFTQNRTLAASVVDALARAWSISSEDVVLSEILMQEVEELKGVLESAKGEALTVGGRGAFCLRVSRRSAAT
ncbi:HD domain-containing protein [Melittangium boletus]|uniref:ATP-binding region ATPase n=1 Tax=Melittangium boletus DSM 14713 TaxID=1294270 RepID=A0A250IAD8_9BACT|nr:ATP-binding protein [Melittangium boletus]ATB28122.1 ATP-binding region ATPase [Melittangium boletus DSM 14713]